MFLQLLASELLKAPDLNSDLVDGEAVVSRIPRIQTLEDLEVLGKYRRRTYNSEDLRAINLHLMESEFFKAKHFQGDASNFEEDFV